jgi:hypothetical protein
MKWFRHIVGIGVAAVILSGCSFNPLEYKAKSGLQIITDSDKPSAVFINGQYLNKTPLIEKNLKPGTYKILIQPENSEYVSYETDITLRTGLLTVITWKPDKRPELSSGVILELEKLKDTAKSEVSFSTIPDNAIVTFSSKKEFSPVVISEAPSGVQSFEVALPSYETQSHTIDIQPGYRTHITVKLGKLQAGNAQDIQVAPDVQASESASSSAIGGVARDATVSATLSATPAATSNTITILKTNFYQDGKEVLRVRATPDSRGVEQGFAPVGTQHQYLGEQRNGWYKISFNGSEGWVNGAYAKLN